MRVNRIQLPQQASQDEATYRRAYGDQPEWAAGLPMAYHVLASPDTGEPFLEAPDDDQFDSPGYMRAATYYNTLLQLLVFHLGWPRPDRGIPAAIDNGAGGPVLDLVHTIWDSDGTLELLWAWLADTGTDYLSQVRHGLAEISGRPADDTRPEQPDHLQRALERAAREGIPAPKSDGGSDLFHLGQHALMPLENTSEAPRLTSTSKAERTAHLAIPGLGGWYATLADAGSSLPDLGNRSWHIHVYVDTVGYLGPFRRSRETGLWFTGQHRVHVLGQ